MNAKVIQLHHPKVDHARAVREFEQKLGLRQIKGGQCLVVMDERAKSMSLSVADRGKLASGLHMEIKKLQEYPALCREPFDTRKLVLRADLADPDVNPTKRLPEFVRNPYAKSVTSIDAFGKKINTSYASFARLIRALLTFTLEDPDKVCDRIFAGTSMQGTEVDASEHRRLALSLEKRVKNVDHQLARFTALGTVQDVFNLTARTKREIQEKGSNVNWPFSDFDPEWQDAEDYEWPDWTRPYWPQQLKGKDLQSEDLRVALLHAMSLDWQDALVYLPRIYLGSVMYPLDYCLDLREKPGDAANRFASLNLNHRQVVELRSMVNGQSKVMWQTEHTGTYPDEEVWREKWQRTYTFSGSNSYDCYLVIYPDPIKQGLCACLYWPCEEGGVDFGKVDETSLHIMSHIFCSTAADGPVVTTLYERIKALLHDEDKTLDREWMRTAFDLLKNPVLQEAGIHSG